MRLVVRGELPHPPARRAAQPRVPREGGVGLQEAVVGRAAVGVDEDLDDAEALVDGREQRPVARLALPQRLLGPPPLVDVDRRPRPADDRAVRVADRGDAGEVPAVGPVGPAEPVLDLVGLARLGGGPEARLDPRRRRRGGRRRPSRRPATPPRRSRCRRARRGWRSRRRRPAGRSRPAGGGRRRRRDRGRSPAASRLRSFPAWAGNVGNDRLGSDGSAEVSQQRGRRGTGDGARPSPRRSAAARSPTAAAAAPLTGVAVRRADQVRDEREQAVEVEGLGQEGGDGRVEPLRRHRRAHQDHRHVGEVRDGSASPGTPPARPSPASSRPSAPGRAAPGASASSAACAVGRPRRRRSPRRRSASATTPAQHRLVVDHQHRLHGPDSPGRRGRRLDRVGGGRPGQQPRRPRRTTPPTSIPGRPMANSRIAGSVAALAGLEDRDQPVQRGAELDVAQQDAVVHRRRDGRDRHRQLGADVGVDLDRHQRRHAPLPQRVGQRRDEGRQPLGDGDQPLDVGEGVDEEPAGPVLVDWASRSRPRPRRRATAPAAARHSTRTRPAPMGPPGRARSRPPSAASVGGRLVEGGDQPRLAPRRPLGQEAAGRAASCRPPACRAASCWWPPAARRRASRRGRRRRCPAAPARSCRRPDRRPASASRRG